MASVSLKVTSNDERSPRRKVSFGAFLRNAAYKLYTQANIEFRGARSRTDQDAIVMTARSVVERFKQRGYL